MNDQRIFECIAAAQGSLSVHELARQMSVEVDDARGQLAALLAVGDIIIVRGEYDFSERFKRGDVHARLMKRAAAVAFAAKEKQGELEDRAMLFLMTRGGRCSASEMHLALGLRPEQLASHELSDALRAGRLFKEEAEWFIDRRATPRQDASSDLEEDLAAVSSGLRAPPAPALFQDEFSPVRAPAPSVAWVVFDDGVAEAEPVPQMLVGVVPDLPPVEHLRIAGYRQNGLRLQRGTGEALILTSDETRRLRNFLVQHPEKAL